jgi:hypothetical protein
VPAGRIYTVADIAADPHYAARGMLQQVTLDDGSRWRCPASCPNCRARPAATPQCAALGQDTDAVLREIGSIPRPADRLARTRHHLRNHHERIFFTSRSPPATASRSSPTSSPPTPRSRWSTR